MPFPKKLKVVYDRGGCIGAQACVSINSLDWKMNEDGKADLTNSAKEGDMFVKIVSVANQEEFDRVVESAKVCPVNIIGVWDLENSQKIAP